ncbi:hypothetical protein QP254_23770, partial [Klebsiella quasivariicola]|nr:hypothetical protein [Klebsiella quasivariicola]MDK7208967.1 hypothetical protein [Klebsiella quasivariicola]
VLDIYSSLSLIWRYSYCPVFQGATSMERNSVRAAYIHKAEHIDERRLMLQWWADFLDVNREREVSPYDFGK